MINISPSGRPSEARELATGCIACNSSKNLCDCLKWNAGQGDGPPCCGVCDHPAP